MVYLRRSVRRMKSVDPTIYKEAIEKETNLLQEKLDYYLKAA